MDEPFNDFSDDDYDENLDPVATTMTAGCLLQCQVRRAKPMDVTGLYVFGDDGKSYNATEVTGEEWKKKSEDEERRKEKKKKKKKKKKRIPLSLIQFEML